MMIAGILGYFGVNLLGTLQHLKAEKYLRVMLLILLCNKVFAIHSRYNNGLSKNAKNH
jgi:hypothetical protein